MKCKLAKAVCRVSRLRSELRRGKLSVECSRNTRHSTLDTCHASRSRFAFTLMEVMIACGIFFMAMFAILALVSNTLRNARGLQRGEVDAGMVAAQLSKTNRVTEGGDSGDFGDAYPEFSWETESFEAETNGL